MGEWGKEGAREREKGGGREAEGGWERHGDEKTDELVDHSQINPETEVHALHGELNPRPFTALAYALTTQHE